VLAVARGAAVGGHHAVERAVPAPEPRQPDPDHHGFVFLEFLAGAGAAFFPPPAALRSSRVVWAQGFKGGMSVCASEIDSGLEYGLDLYILHMGLSICSHD